jgi:hypothetical protein
MCPSSGGGGTPPPDPGAEARKKQALEREQAEATELKEKQYEERVASVYGRRGRRSLLSGSKGGSGFELDRGLMSKNTLGA